MENNNENGLIIFDKPKGLTSQEAITFIKKVFRLNKAGHLGTLDPFATGVLVVLTNKFTKLAPYFPVDNKVYEATILFGKVTREKDITGEEIPFDEAFNSEEKNFYNIPTKKEIKDNLENLSQADIMSVLPKFIGKVKQYVPSFSAIKRDGVKFYELARENKEVPIVSREVNIDNIEFLDFDKDKFELRIKVTCSGGTYIRALAEDIGKTLGVPALTSELRRIESNGFNIKDSVDFDTLAKVGNNLGDIKNYLVPLTNGLKDFTEIEITKKDKEKFKIGKEFEVTYCKDSDKVLVYFEEELIGIGSAKNLILHPRKVFI